MARRPTFFLSSTIFDFRDLRGAIKYTLEARGCRVLASEFNDFRGDLDRHSYEACLDNIGQADFFVLLIGGRVGGWYDEPARVSITRQEYRTAYERHRRGLLRLVTLVRSEVWQLREDRKALEHHLAEMGMAEAERTVIAGAPSRFATDAAHVSDFLAEVGRNRETATAVRTGGAKPTGNWVHQFRDFRDVQDVLEPLAFSGATAQEAAFSTALQNELLVVASRLLLKVDGRPSDHRRPMREYLRKWPVKMEWRQDVSVPVGSEAWFAFSTLFVDLVGARLDMVVIEAALTSGVFLEYDSSAGAYVQTEACAALATLVEEIRLFNLAATTEVLSIVFDYSPRCIGRRPEVELPTVRLIQLHHLAHRWINVLSLALALATHLGGHPFQMPELMPSSPIQGMEDTLAAERVTAGELRATLGL